MEKRSLTDYASFFYYTLIHKGKSLNRTIETFSKSRNAQPEANSSIRVLKENANELGITVEDLADDAYEFKYGNEVRRVTTGPIFDLESAFAFWLCGNKYATYELLRKYDFQSLPHYQRYSFSTINKARRDFLNRNKAAVIKPCSGTSGGKGVTVNIRNIGGLNRAIFSSLMYDSNYLMEDYIEGDHFRVLFYKDRMLDAIQRIPANVKGDGKNNIGNLIRIENERRAKEKMEIELMPIVIDNDVKQYLLNRNMSLTYVPKDGEIVIVKGVANHSAGGEIRNTTGMIHDDVIRECRKIMRILGVTLGGIDVITKNIDKPLAETGGVINEVNTSPGLDIHDKAVIKKLLLFMFEDV